MDPASIAATLTGAQQSLAMQNTQVSLLKQQTDNRNAFLDMIMTQASQIANTPPGQGTQINLRA
jgi:hypothetical protein